MLLKSGRQAREIDGNDGNLSETAEVGRVAYSKSAFYQPTFRASNLHSDSVWG
jgi:hypothetical protein